MAKDEDIGQTGSPKQPQNATVPDLVNLTQGLAGTDPDRVRALRLKLESGTYSVDASKLASKIIDAHTKI